MAPRDGGRPSATQSGLEVFGLCNWGCSMRSAMRHTHPHAVTLVLSGYPELQEAMSAILLQADKVLVKPIEIASLKDLIPQKASEPSSSEVIQYRERGLHTGARPRCDDSGLDGAGGGR